MGNLEICLGGGVEKKYRYHIPRIWSVSVFEPSAHIPKVTSHTIYNLLKLTSHITSYILKLTPHIILNLTHILKLTSHVMSNIVKLAHLSHYF